MAGTPRRRRWRGWAAAPLAVTLALVTSGCFGWPTLPPASPRASSSATASEPAPGATGTAPPGSTAGSTAGSTPGAGAAPSSTSTPAPTGTVCASDWGTAPKWDPTHSGSPVVDVRSGRHTCFDRLVVDLHGGAPGYSVQYVPAVLEEGRGGEVGLRGAAFLSVVVFAPAYDPGTGESTYLPEDPSEMVDVAGYESFRQVSFAGSFEGQTTIGVGVAAAEPFRVFSLDGPGGGSRVVVDVVHPG